MPLKSNKGKTKHSRNYLEFDKNPAPQEHEPDPGLLAQLWGRVVEPASYPWKPVPFWALVVTSVCFAFFDVFTEDGFIGPSFFLDERVA